MGAFRLTCILLISFGVGVSGEQSRISLSVPNHFFPYGNGDSELASGNDESEGLDLQNGINFPFYGQSYNRIYVQTNGLLSFNGSVALPQSDNTQNNFPLDPSREDGAGTIPMIAPFWADADTTGQRGAVYYRESAATVGEDSERATNLVRERFPQYPAFQSQWVLIVTWNNVSFNVRNASSSIDPRNTFQSVLVTDGEKSFAFLFYDSITWTAGTVLGGNPNTGIPEHAALQAVVGFNKGDGHQFSTDGIPATKQHLAMYSNIGHVGAYAYRVDGETIAQGGCPEGETCEVVLNVTSTTPAEDNDGSTEPQGGFPAWAIIIIVLLFIGSAIGLLLIYIVKKGKGDKASSPKKVQYSSVKSGSGVYEPTTEDA